MSDRDQLSFTDLMNRAFDEDSGTLRVAPVAGAPTKGAPSVTVVFPTTSPTLLLAANADRKEALLVNNGTQTVYIYPGSSFTISGAIPLVSNAAFTDDLTVGAWYGLVASATGDVRIIEVE